MNDETALELLRASEELMSWYPNKDTHGFAELRAAIETARAERLAKLHANMISAGRLWDKAVDEKRDGMVTMTDAAIQRLADYASHAEAAWLAEAKRQGKFEEEPE